MKHTTTVYLKHEPSFEAETIKWDDGLPCEFELTYLGYAIDPKLLSDEDFQSVLDQLEEAEREARQAAAEEDEIDRHLARELRGRR